MTIRMQMSHRIEGFLAIGANARLSQNPDVTERQWTMRTAFPLLVAALLVAGCSNRTDSDGTADLVKRLCEVTRVPQAIESARDEQVASMKSMFAANTNLSADVLQTVDGMIAHIEKSLTWDNIQEEYVRIYDGVFSTNELQEIIAFYESPAGRKLVAETPGIQKREKQFFLQLATRMATNMAMPTERMTLEAVP